MKDPFKYLLFACWLLTSLVSRGNAVDSLSEEPFASFIAQLKTFSETPETQDPNGLKMACLQLPVRDVEPGQIGEGYPSDREAKLRCMLRFVATMDNFVQDHLPTAYVNVWVPDLPVAGMDPGQVADPLVRANYLKAINANNAAIQVVNFQVQLKNNRDGMVRVLIPRFLERMCRTVPAADLQEIIRDELQRDVRAKTTMNSLSKLAGDLYLLKD